MPRLFIGSLGRALLGLGVGNSPWRAPNVARSRDMLARVRLERSAHNLYV